MRLTLLLATILLAGCNAETESEADMAAAKLTGVAMTEAMLGTWEITEMRVTAPTYLGADSTFSQHITEADWSRVYGVKPAQTIYTDDGKLKRTYYFKNGQVTDVVNGLWRIKNDSLQVIEPNITLNYLPTIEGEKLKLKGLIDYDRDGEVDDRYEANFRLVARTQ